MPRPLAYANYLLDAVFAAPSHLAILRALQDNKEGLSGRGVARAAGINHQSCAKGIQNLERMGLLQRLGAGQSQLVRLQRKNHIVCAFILPLLRQEAALLKTLSNDIVRMFGKRVKSI